MSTPDAQPGTEAGLTLLEDLDLIGALDGAVGSNRPAIVRDILAIEEEARAIGRDRTSFNLASLERERSGMQARISEPLNALRRFYGIDTLREIGVSSNTEIALWDALDAALAGSPPRPEPPHREAQGK